MEEEKEAEEEEMVYRLRWLVHEEEEEAERDETRHFLAADVEKKEGTVMWG